MSIVHSQDTPQSYRNLKSSMVNSSQRPRCTGLQRIPVLRIPPRGLGLHADWRKRLAAFNISNACAFFHASNCSGVQVLPLSLLWQSSLTCAVLSGPRQSGSPQGLKRLRPVKTTRLLGCSQLPPFVQFLSIARKRASYALETNCP